MKLILHLINDIVLKNCWKKCRFIISGICGLDEGAIYNNCSSSADHEVLSILQQAEMQGLSTGIVTTARVTHATPACAYSHIANRNWEASAPDGCKDIGRK